MYIGSRHVSVHDKSLYATFPVGIWSIFSIKVAVEMIYCVKKLLWPSTFQIPAIFSFCYSPFQAYGAANMNAIVAGRAESLSLYFDNVHMNKYEGRDTA